MDSQPLNSHQVADLLVPLRGPYDPDRVVEAAWTVGELVRRINHATIGDAILLDPHQVNRTVTGLREALYGLEQTFDQIGDRLDALATDPRVEAHPRHDSSTVCRTAAGEVRQAAANLHAVVAPLARAGNLTGPLGYDTTRTRAFPAGPDVPTGPRPASPASDPPPSRLGRPR